MWCQKEEGIFNVISSLSRTHIAASFCRNRVRQVQSKLLIQWQVKRNVWFLNERFLTYGMRTKLIPCQYHLLYLARTAVKQYISDESEALLQIAGGPALHWCTSLTPLPLISEPFLQILQDQVEVSTGFHTQTSSWYHFMWLLFVQQPVQIWKTIIYHL